MESLSLSSSSKLDDNGDEVAGLIPLASKQPDVSKLLSFILDRLHKLLTWMHRKFRQGNGETPKEFPLGQQFLDDPHFYQKQNQGKQRRASFTSVETRNFAEYERKASSADEFPEYFEGFLAIGTFGVADAVIPEPETPTFEVSFDKLAEGEAEVTENELRLINDELERVLASEAKDDGWTDSSGRNSHVSNGRISHASTITLSGKPLEIPESTGGTGSNLMYCPLQEYLLGSAVEVPEKATVPKKENRTSLGELFERHKAEETSDVKNSSASTRGPAESGSAETKLCKILQKFHKKVHPECLISTEKSNKMHKNGIKDMMPSNAGYFKDEHTFPDENNTAFSQKAGQNGYMLSRRSISNPTQYTEDGSDSNGSRECWIKTDADYNSPQQLQGASRAYAVSPSQAEGLAILRAIKEVPRDCSNLVIKSDSIVVIRALKQPSKADDELRSIVKDILLEACTRDFVACIKVDRSNVHKAHFLAVSCRKCG
uniref:Uncharacterized protein n=1 Tax=Chenopodium quinoa TaxID=63459 RepID=A0A803L1B1_CHEQI